jgi:hypothetical protein
VHAAYLQNRSYMTFLKVKTPYQIWYDKKLNIEHLWEFGALMWVTLQGQNKPRKMLPKSQRRAYVGYEDGSKSIKYYNADTQKVLHSWNYHFLTISKTTPPEEIEVAIDLPHEGEMEDGMLLMSSDSQKRKHVDEEEDDIRKSKCAKHVDYRYLHNPKINHLFTDEEDERNKLLKTQLLTYINEYLKNCAYVSNDDCQRDFTDPLYEPKSLEAKKLKMGYHG